MNDDALARLGADVGGAIDKSLDARPLPPLPSLPSLPSLAVRGTPTPARFAVPIGVSALAAAAVVAIVVTRGAEAPAPVVVDDGPTAWVTPAATQRVWHLADRSVIVVEPGARARLVRPDGGPLAVELALGRLSADLRAPTRLAVRAFTVDAGAGRVDIDAAGTTAHVRVLTGSAEIRGPGIVGSRMVLAGQDATLEESAPPRIVDDGDAVDEPRPTKAAPAHPRPTRAAPTDTAAPAWRALAEADRHTEAVAAARSAGIERLLDDAPAADLMLLGASARLGGASDVAERCYERVRARAAGSEDAANATFLLGRLRADVDGDAHGALDLFGAYLTLRPAGPFAADARRRVDELTHR